jgi:hypothetical protein
LAELGIARKAGIIGCCYKAFDEATPELVFGPGAGMQQNHRGLATTRFGKVRRPAEHFSPVAGESLDVLGMARVRERVVQLGILQASLVMRCGEA